MTAEENKSIELAEELFDKYSDNIDNNIDTMSFFAGKDVILKTQFIKAIQEYAEHSPLKEQWISVEERLPETCVDVLLWHTTYETPVIGYYFKAHERWKGSQNSRDCMKDGYCNDSDLICAPTHWQPLPTPPVKK